MRRTIKILLFATLLVACSKQESSYADYSPDVSNDELMSVTQQSYKDEAVAENIEKVEVKKKKIIKSGSIGLKVTQIEDAKKQIDAVVKKFDAYYANESFTNNDYQASYELKIRIPAADFEKFLAGVEDGEWEILFKDINANDVTDQFIDLEARLDSKRNYLKRYNDLLKQAKSIKEILEIEEKIRRLQEEIESTTGRLKYLGDQVDYSTLDLTITKRKDFRYNPVTRDKFTERFKQSMSKGWFNLVDFLLFVLKLWPFWILLFIGIRLWIRIKAKRKKKKS